MEEQASQRPVNPRRRKRSKMQIFKETYLPVIIAGVALILIVVFIGGAISRGIMHRKEADASNIAASESMEEERKRLEAEVQLLIDSSGRFASNYEFDRAIAAIDSFSGDIAQFPQLSDLRNQYNEAKNHLVAWEDPAQIKNLSFMPLMVDTARAFKDEIYGQYYNRRFVTVSEFSEILKQLYGNGYVLVGLDDFVAVDENGVAHTQPIYLPEGKKPVMITQTNVSYPYLLTDGDNDKIPDAKGDGFANKLILDADGKLTCEYIDADGQVLTGAYDLVPILNAFVASNPGFSYKGAKATLAVTGHDGIFGYRTHKEAERVFGTAVYEQSRTEAKAVAEALRKEGYDIACYTYGDIGYGEKDLDTVKSDLNRWTSEVVPILGNVDMLVYAQNSDIADPKTTYAGDKYNALHDAGFRYFIGNAKEGTPWFSAADHQVRQGRILVSGTTMAYNSGWFTDLFDAKALLDPSRGTVPQ